MSRNEGGLAFPGGTCGPEYAGVAGCPMNDGMTIRQYLAGQALSGVNLNDLDFGTCSKPANPWPWVAEQCVKAADALIAELEK